MKFLIVSLFLSFLSCSSLRNQSLNDWDDEIENVNSSIMKKVDSNSNLSSGRNFGPRDR